MLGTVGCSVGYLCLNGTWETSNTHLRKTTDKLRGFYHMVLKVKFTCANKRRMWGPESCHSLLTMLNKITIMVLKGSFWINLKYLYSAGSHLTKDITMQFVAPWKNLPAHASLPLKRKLEGFLLTAQIFLLLAFKRGIPKRLLIWFWRTTCLLWRKPWLGTSARS